MAKVVRISLRDVPELDDDGATLGGIVRFGA